MGAPNSRAKIWIIWNAHNQRCATIDSAGTSGITDPFQHITRLINAYDDMLPDDAPHVAELYYHHSAHPDTTAIYLNRIESGPS